MFGSTNIVKDNDKEKYMYSGFGIAFHGKGSLRVNHDFGKSVTIFGIDNSS